MTPNFALVRIQNRRGFSLPIWIPVFLLWIPAVMLAPFLLLCIWMVCVAGRIRIGVGTIVSVWWGVLCSLPGTDVQVCANGNRVTVRIL